MSEKQDSFPPPRFDWWQALIRVLASIEAVRDGRAWYVLLGTFSAAGLLAAGAQAAFGRAQLNWAIAQGACALFVAFYGASAAGLLLMDRAMGLPVREMDQAVRDALGIGHRVLVALTVVALGLGVIVAGLLGLYWASGLPKVGPWLFALVVPSTVVVIGLVLMAGLAVIAPLTGPTVWAGASSWQAVRTLVRLIRERLLQAGVLVAGLSLATGLVGAVASAFVVVGGRVMAEASILMIGVEVPPQVLMAGLFGYGLKNISAAGIPVSAYPYITAATIGGGVVFAIALIMPTLVYLRGVCEIYLALMAADRFEARQQTALQADLAHESRKAQP
ncbi:MAG: hypothetical protein QM742_09545 [Aquabacterium sp.]